MTEINIEANSKITRSYPEIRKGDKVRFLLARSNKRKDTDPIHSSEIVSVIDTSTDYAGNKQPLCFVKRLYQRHELLKV